MHALGIDIGGSGIKGAPVDVTTGKFVTDRQKIATPRPARPDAVADVVKQITASFSWSGPVGITFPGVVIDGVTRTAANLDQAWIGADAAALFSRATGDQVKVLNDADAAGVAEMTFGAGVGQKGTVLMLTFGTGIGSALFTEGVLVPNTEFGHIEIRGHDAETRASERAKELHDLSWGKWAGRVDEYLRHIEALLSPHLIIVGGGISKQSEKWVPRLTGIRARVVPAALLNDAGIVGAAMATIARTGYVATCVEKQQDQAAIQVGTRGRLSSAADWVPGAAQGGLDLPDAQRAEVEHAGRQHRVRARVHGGREVRERARAAAGDDRDRHHGAYRPDQLQVKADGGAVRVHRVQQDLARAEFGGPAGPVHRVDPGAGPAAVRGHLEEAVGPGGRPPRPPRSWGDRPPRPPRPLPRASTDSTMHCDPNRCAVSASRSGRATAAVLSETLSAPARSSRSTSAALRTPPPTVSGMKTCSAVRRTTSYMVSRPPLEAVMSRNVSSSAPSAS